jgi:hypothetical protein
VACVWEAPAGLDSVPSSSGGNTLNGFARLMSVSAAATVLTAATAVAPSTASAAASPVIQTPFTTCRSNLAAPNSVLIIGDSITALWFSATSAQFTAAHRPVCINAQAGRQTAGAVYQLARYKSGGLVKPQTTVVMAIGSNDTYGAKPGYMRWQVDNAQRVLRYGSRYVQPIVWVDVLNWSPNRGAAGQRLYGAGTWVVNLQLWQKDAQYPNLKVARWNALIRNNFTRYLYDGLHTNSYGNTARNALIMRTIGPAV